MDQLSYYQSKLAYETDSADLYEAIENGEAIVVIDGRAASAYAHEHISVRSASRTGRSAPAQPTR